MVGPRGSSDLSFLFHGCFSFSKEKDPLNPRLAGVFLPLSLRANALNMLLSFGGNNSTFQTCLYKLDVCVVCTQNRTQADKSQTLCQTELRAHRFEKSLTDFYKFSVRNIMALELGFEPRSQPRQGRILTTILFELD
jgi:hypothetical protein